MDRFTESEINTIKWVLRNELALIQLSRTYTAERKAERMCELDTILKKIETQKVRQ